MEDRVLAGLEWLDKQVNSMPQSHTLVTPKSLPSLMGLYQGPVLKHQCKNHVMSNSKTWG